MSQRFYRVYERTARDTRFTKMRKFIYGVFIGSSVLIVLCAPEDHMYTTKYDNIDVEAIIKSERLLKGYVGCLLDERPCTADGSELKKNLPDALTNGCSSCSDAQKNIADRIAHHLIDEEPEAWSRLEAKYDPTGSYKKLYLGNKTEDP